MRRYELQYETAGIVKALEFLAAEITTSDGMLWAWDDQSVLVVAMPIWRVVSLSPIE